MYDPDTAFLLTFSLLLATDKVKESLRHEDNFRAIDLNTQQRGKIGTTGISLILEIKT